MIVFHYCLLRRIKACLVKELRRRGDKLVKRLNEIMPIKNQNTKWKSSSTRSRSSSRGSKTNLNFQLVNKPSWISPHEALQSRLSMINKVYQFTSTEFLGGGGEGSEGGVKEKGSLLTFFPLKGGLIERGGSLIEDLLIFIFPQDFN